jgi:hypothetical protein
MCTRVCAGILSYSYMFHSCHKEKNTGKYSDKFCDRFDMNADGGNRNLRKNLLENGDGE